MPKESEAVPAIAIESRIYRLRKQNVMLDKDLAMLYQVETKALNRAVQRNLSRFPEDFMFQLTKEEFESLRYHFGTSKGGRGGTRYLPYAFTEQGIAMLSSVLNSERAIQVNIQIIRTFIKLRHLLREHKDLWQKVEEMEKKYDKQFKVVFDAIKNILEPPINESKKKIGF